MGSHVRQDSQSSKRSRAPLDRARRRVRAPAGGALRRPRRARCPSRIRRGAEAAGRAREAQEAQPGRRRRRVPGPARSACRVPCRRARRSGSPSGGGDRRPGRRAPRVVHASSRSARRLRRSSDRRLRASRGAARRPPAAAPPGAGTATAGRARRRRAERGRGAGGVAVAVGAGGAARPAAAATGRRRCRRARHARARRRWRRGCAPRPSPRTGPAAGPPEAEPGSVEDAAVGRDPRAHRAAVERGEDEPLGIVLEPPQLRVARPTTSVACASSQLRVGDEVVARRLRARRPGSCGASGRVSPVVSSTCAGPMIEPERAQRARRAEIGGDRGDVAASRWSPGRSPGPRPARRRPRPRRSCR